jgi:NADH-quinone oxidoreductase subunit J
MTPDVFLFWFLAAVVLLSGATVILVPNPIYSALALAMTMVGIAALFVTLNAYFLAGVQLIVYAGAVMVLFVMVLMIFDLKQEVRAFSRGVFSGAMKIASVGLFAGLVAGAVALTAGSFIKVSTNPALELGADTTKQLGKMLFTQYLFGFEALGVLLLVVAIGAVALSRSKGGTHAKH